MKSTSLASLLTTGMLIATSANADLIAYEGFDYDLNTSLSAATGGVGFSSGWNQITAGNDLVVDGQTPNRATNLTHTGNRVSKVGGGPDTGTLYRRSLPTQTFADGDVFWFSFQLNGAFNSGFNNGLTLRSGGQDELFIVNNPTAGSPNRAQINVIHGNNIREDQGTTPTDLTNDIEFSGSSNFASYIVGKVTFQDGDDLLDLYYGGFVPAGEGGLGSNMPAVFSGLSITDFNSIDEIELDINNSAQGSFDEIRLATTFADVRLGTTLPEPEPDPIPEPASMALVALGGALLAARRRR